MDEASNVDCSVGIEGIEKLRNLISVTFEKLDCDAANNIIQALVVAGMEKFEDLDYVTEEDLKACLKPIQFRKLMRAFKNAVEEQMDPLMENDIAIANKTAQTVYQMNPHPEGQ